MIQVMPRVKEPTVTKKSARSSKGQRAGYIRVSTLDQREDRQLDGVELDRRFVDRTSGKDIKRPQLTAVAAKIARSFSSSIPVEPRSPTLIKPNGLKWLLQ